MTTLQELSLKEVFEIRDALVTLDKYGYANEQLKQEVNEVISDFRDGGDR